jgi:hypothetical protein
MKHLWTEHPASVGETYLQHLGSAWYFAGQMTLGALVCFVHGLLPFIFEKSASGRVAHLYDRMIFNRSRLTPNRPIGTPPPPPVGTVGATDFHHPVS